MACKCQKCGKEYKLDLLNPDEVWCKIIPSNNKEAGLLCPFCSVTELEKIYEYLMFKLRDGNQPQSKDSKLPIPLVSNCACKLVRIGWADAIENLEGWHTEKEALEWADDDDWIVHQVGWVLKETDDYILLSNKYNEASGGRDGTFGGLFKIPKPWIKYCNEV